MFDSAFFLCGIAIIAYKGSFAGRICGEHSHDVTVLVGRAQLPGIFTQSGKPVYTGLPVHRLMEKIKKISIARRFSQWLLALSVLTGLSVSAAAGEAGPVEMLQDLILAAVNDALAKSNEMASEQMKGLTGGFDIPGMT